MRGLVLVFMAIFFCYVTPSLAQESSSESVLDVHSEFFEKVSEARQLGLEALNTQVFADDLRRFYDAYNNTDRIPAWSGFKQEQLNLYNEAWSKKSVEEILTEVRRSAPSLSVRSKGGIKQWARFKISGNIADEPRNGGPIVLNKFALSGRSKSSIAGSIIHEGAHRIGLRHDNYSDFLRVGKCEPPYVINQLIERILEQDAWEYDQLDCELLSDWPTSTAILE